MSTASSSDGPTPSGVGQKQTICRELEQIVSVASSECQCRQDKPLSKEFAQALCTIVEAVFIHGLRGAFFLRRVVGHNKSSSPSSSKHPAPNFWPLISKYTHRSIKQQIGELGHIKTEVGKARAWIRIVLAEHTLEHYLSLFADDPQISQFYSQSAFLRDPDSIAVLTRSLKALAHMQARIEPTFNSSLLDTWTPSPLALAGLIQPGQNAAAMARALNGSRASLAGTGGELYGEEAEEEEEPEQPEMATNALDLLTGTETPLEQQQKDLEMNSMTTTTMATSARRSEDVFITRSHEQEEDKEDTESVLSHPSILEEHQHQAMNRPNRRRRLMPSSMELAVNDTASSIGDARAQEELTRLLMVPSGAAPQPMVEHTQEVVVHRRRPGGRYRALSRSSHSSTATSNGGDGQQRGGGRVEAVQLVETGTEAEHGQTLEAGDEPVGVGEQDEMEKGNRGTGPVDDHGMEQQEMNQHFQQDMDKQQVVQAVQLGISLEEELLLAERTAISTFLHSSQAEVAKEEEKLDVGTQHTTSSAKFIVCPPSTGSSSNTDLPATFDEAIREFLSRENSHLQDSRIEREQHAELEQSILTKSRSEELLDDVPASRESVASSDGHNLLLFMASEWGSEQQQKQQEKEEPEMVHSPSGVWPLSPRAELPQLPLDKQEVLMTAVDDAKQLKEDGDRLIEIPPPVELINSTSSHAERPYQMPRRLLFLTHLPLELGLDKQDFRCRKCRRNIGAGFGAFRTCALNGLNYCAECFGHEECLIPARAIQSGDFRPRPVSRESRALLRAIVDRPLFRVDFLNGQLYEHSKQMRKIRDLRKRLSLLVLYLLSCKNSVAEDMKQRLWPNEHLHADIHMYSYSDLNCVADGAMERRLNVLITFALQHVQHCALCLQKGFFCELCSSGRPIYPFQTEITYQCTNCSSSFHRDCAIKSGLIAGKSRQKRQLSTATESTSSTPQQQSTNCPKCLRRAKYSSSAALSSLASGNGIGMRATMVEHASKQLLQ